MSDKLLSCPFCGGDKVDGMFIRDGWRVGCFACGAGVHAYHPEAHKRAAEKWNLRTTLAAGNGTEGMTDEERIEHWKGAYDRMSARSIEDGARIAALEAEIARLRKALEPFAAVGRRFADIPITNMLPQQIWCSAHSLREAIDAFEAKP